MPTPREQAGGFAEASRLLQEGLQLLEQRRREVDAILEDARERALNINVQAEERARKITAEAEQQRAELEEHVATLRAEVSALREELASAKSANPANAQPSTPAFAELEPDDSDDVSANTPNAPQWGRRVSANTVPEALDRSSGKRRGRLPVWLLFLLLVLVLLLVAAGLVVTNVNGQPGLQTSV